MISAISVNVTSVLRHCFLVAMLMGATSITCSAQSGTKAYTWPHGAKAAVSLAYDDALDSQLDHAIPALNKYGIKASFYLTLASPTVSRRLHDWRQAASDGHELGNHSLFHQCSHTAADRAWVSVENDLDTVSAAQMLAQIRLGNSMLHAIDGRLERTFTAPCGDLLAKGEPYLPLIKDDFVAIKLGLGGVAAKMATLDPYAVNVAVPSDVTGAQLIEIVERAAALGTMANITFHGVGGDHLAVSLSAHETLLAYLASHRQEYWSDTFLNVMTYVKARSKLKLD